MADATTQVCYIERAAGATSVWNGLELDNCNKRIAGVFPVPAQYPRTAHFCPTQTEIDAGFWKLTVLLVSRKIFLKFCFFPCAGGRGCGLPSGAWVKRVEVSKKLLSINT